MKLIHQWEGGLHKHDTHTNTNTHTHILGFYSSIDCRILKSDWLKLRAYYDYLSLTCPKEFCPNRMKILYGPKHKGLWHYTEWPRKNATLTINNFKKTRDRMKQLCALLCIKFFSQQDDTKIVNFDEGVLILWPFFWGNVIFKMCSLCIKSSGRRQGGWAGGAVAPPPPPYGFHFFFFFFFFFACQAVSHGHGDTTPTPLWNLCFFRAGATFLASRSSSESFCPPLSKHPGAVIKSHVWGREEFLWVAPPDCNAANLRNECFSLFMLASL